MGRRARSVQGGEAAPSGAAAVVGKDLVKTACAPWRGAWGEPWAQLVGVCTVLVDAPPQCQGGAHWGGAHESLDFLPSFSAGLKLLCAMTSVD